LLWIIWPKAAETVKSAVEHDDAGDMKKAKAYYMAAVEFLDLAKLQYGKDKSVKSLVDGIEKKQREYIERAEQLQKDMREIKGHMRPPEGAPAPAGGAAAKAKGDKDDDSKEKDKMVSAMESAIVKESPIFIGKTLPVCLRRKKR